MWDISSVPFTLIALALVCIAFALGWILGRITRWKHLKDERQDATRRARNVLMGETLERIAPLLDDFPYHPRDCTFIGRGIDYLVFPGMATGNCTGIVLLEVKQGQNANLNANERTIKKLVEAGKVSYEVYRQH